MSVNKPFLFYILTLTILSGNALANNFTINALQNEYLINPIGIDSADPRLTWQINSTAIGAEHLVFGIIVGSAPAQMVSGRGEMWKNGKTAPERSHKVYAGKPLQAFLTDYRLAFACFENGMMQVHNWQGKWINMHENRAISADNDLSMNRVMFREIGAWSYKGPGK